MEQEHKVLRWGLILIAVSIGIRLFSSGLFTSVLNLVTDPRVASFLVYLETGRVLRPELPTVVPAESSQPTAPPTLSPAPEVSFTPEDGDWIDVFLSCDLPFDQEALLLSELDWDLQRSEPTVLILHTHATESYTKTTEQYDETYYRTLNENYNMVRIGDRVTQLLEEAGICVIHDRTLHDNPSYEEAYDRSRATAAAYLAQYPSISLILDLHRDAADMAQGQLRTLAHVDGRESAQLMLVVGTEASGLSHPNWQQNMALAEKLHVVLQKENPGVCRPILLRRERFNQDLHPGFLLVEVGGAGNTLPEALLAADALAEAIITLAPGVS